MLAKIRGNFDRSELQSVEMRSVFTGFTSQGPDLGRDDEDSDDFDDETTIISR